MKILQDGIDVDDNEPPVRDIIEQSASLSPEEVVVFVVVIIIGFYLYMRFNDYRKNGGRYRG